MPFHEDLPDTRHGRTPMLSHSSPPAKARRKTKERPALQDEQPLRAGALLNLNLKLKVKNVAGHDAQVVEIVQRKRGVPVDAEQVERADNIVTDDVLDVVLHVVLDHLVAFDIVTDLHVVLVDLVAFGNVLGLVFYVELQHLAWFDLVLDVLLDLVLDLLLDVVLSILVFAVLLIAVVEVEASALEPESVFARPEQAVDLSATTTLQHQLQSPVWSSFRT